MNCIRFSLLPGLVGGLLASASAAGEVIVRSSVVPEEALVGQRVILRVEVLGRDGWARIERADNFEAPGAFIYRTQTQGTRIQETVAGDSYTGQRYELSIYPQRAGEIRLAPVAARVSNRSWGLNARETLHEVELPGVTLLARYPPGAENLRGLVATTRLEARQEWSSESTSFKVGEAIERQVVFSARDIPGMAFLPLEHGDIPSVQIYPAEPLTEDRTERGVLSGRRTESVTYLFEQPGEVILPPIAVNWWDLSQNALQRVELAGLVIQVEPGDAAPLEAIQSDASGPSGHSGFRWLLVTVIGLFLAVMLWRRPVRETVKEWLQKRHDSEKVAFHAVLKAFSSSDSAVILREIMRWIDRLPETDGASRLDTFLERYGNPETRRLGHRMATLAIQLDDAELAQFRRGLQAARKKWKLSLRVAVRQKKAAQCLPELN